MKNLRSIRTKLLVLVWLATFSALTVAGGVFLLYDIDSYRVMRVNDLRTQVELLSYSSVPALQFDDEKVASNNLELLRFKPSVKAAAVYDAHGRIFAHYVRATDTYEFPELPGDEGLAERDSSLLVFKRIVENGEILGTVYMNADFLLGERILRYMGIFTLVVVGAMGVAGLICMWLQSAIIRPIRAIGEIARAVIHNRDYTTRAQKISGDEVGILVDAFNDMLTEIESRTRALQSSNKELEQEIAERTQARETILKMNEELEGKVAERTQQLQVTNQELESFCYSVSHDLRGPLRSISGFSQALVEELPAELPGESRRYLDKIFAATHRMGQLIEDLLNMSRVSRGELVRQPMNLSQITQEVINDLQARDPAWKVAVSVWQGMVVEADPRLVRIVLENLLGNAWKFTSKHATPTIMIGEVKDGAHKVYFVRDNGAGFDMKYAGKLFGAFQRLHGVNEFPGTGIGLATVQRIINRHGGRIWFDSAPGNGAVFYFTLKHETARAQETQGVATT